MGGTILHRFRQTMETLSKSSLAIFCPTHSKSIFGWHFFSGAGCREKQKHKNTVINTNTKFKRSVFRHSTPFGKCAKGIPSCRHQDSRHVLNGLLDGTPLLRRLMCRRTSPGRTKLSVPKWQRSSNCYSAKMLKEVIWWSGYFLFVVFPLVSHNVATVVLSGVYRAHSVSRQDIKFLSAGNMSWLSL